MVSGPPSSICLLNKGTTEPLLPNTFPNLVVTKPVVFFKSLLEYS